MKTLTIGWLIMELLKQYALSFLGANYLWGGQSPNKGIDCSGYVVEVLQSVNPKQIDMTAQQLYDHYIKKGQSQTPQLGALAFFGTSKDHITHVGFMVDDFRMIHASKADGYVQIVPVNSVKHLIDIVLPDYYHYFLAAKCIMYNN